MIIRASVADVDDHPEPGDALGATFFRILATYAEQIGAAGGRLYVSGLDPDMAQLLARTVPVTAEPPERVFGATPVLGEATWAALHERHKPGSSR